MEPWPIIDPHATLAYLFEDGQLENPSGDLANYWKLSKEYQEPWAQSMDENEMSCTVPIGIYGDSARVDTAFGSENILALFLNVVLWRPRSVRWSRFLICAIAEERLTSETIPSLLRRITWSCNHAFHGRHPLCGQFGQVLVGKAAGLAGKQLTSNFLKFRVAELRGDWSFHKKIWRFAEKTHWNGVHVCHLCNVKGISDVWEELYFNLETNTHEDFSLPQFIARRVTPHRVCNLLAMANCCAVEPQWDKLPKLIELHSFSVGVVLALHFQCLGWSKGPSPLILVECKHIYTKLGPKVQVKDADWICWYEDIFWTGQFDDVVCSLLSECLEVHCLASSDFIIPPSGGAWCTPWILVFSMLPMVGRCYLPATGVLPLVCKVISRVGGYLYACMHAYILTPHTNTFLVQPVMPSKFWVANFVQESRYSKSHWTGPKVVVVVVVTAAWLVIACPLASFRHVLLKCGIWGTPDETVQVRLHRAYLAFKRWCSSNKIACSQPAFQPRHVPRLLVYYWCLRGKLPLTCQTYPPWCALAVHWHSLWTVAFCFPMPVCQTELYQKNGDVSLVCKAYNGRVVMQWLAETIAEVSQRDDVADVDDRIGPIALCMLLALCIII